MGVQVAGTWSASTTPSQAAVFAAVVSTVVSSKRKGIVGCTFLRAGESARLLRTRSMEVGGGRGRQPLGHGFLRRRAFGARTECFPSSGVDDGRAEEDNVEEFAQRLEESILELQRQQGNGGDASLFSASFCLNTSSPPSLSKQEPSTEPPWVPVKLEPPDWPGQIVPASVEKKQIATVLNASPLLAVSIFLIDLSNPFASSLLPAPQFVHWSSGVAVRWAFELASPKTASIL
ncbi:hypothetical protein ZIOFF_019685 [Zingiber officinale]|uniref:Uncharacterized protein n=1 Tax=Zingiber officinale TaxID=94328 RepID=A0A8J5H7C5_ZINOF|nr:hypothetical protein ZIOFF_019685 [Zingiber officinale]